MDDTTLRARALARVLRDEVAVTLERMEMLDEVITDKEAFHLAKGYLLQGFERLLRSLGAA